MQTIIGQDTKCSTIAGGYLLKIHLQGSFWEFIGERIRGSSKEVSFSGDIERKPNTRFHASLNHLLYQVEDRGAKVFPPGTSRAVL